MLNLNRFLINEAVKETCHPPTINRLVPFIRRLTINTVVAGYLVALFLISGCINIASRYTVYQPDFPVKPGITIPEAQEIISGKLQAVYNSCWQRERYQNVQVTMMGFSFFDPGGVQAFGANAVPPRSRSYEFRKLHDLTVDRWPNWHGVHVIKLGEDEIYWCGSEEDARKFIDAINVMIYYSSDLVLADDAASFAEFKEKAGAWRALPVKPALTERVQRFRVLAEDSIQNKKFEQALYYYEQALAVTPLWPEGQFNAALLYGEFEMYPQAVLHMKRYLELSPDAKDAQPAREKMFIWEEKSKKGTLPGLVGKQPLMQPRK